MGNKNEYLQQVMASQEDVEQQLKRRTQALGHQPGGVTSTNYKITGFWRFQNVIVPPNMYVVHTRRGVREPVNIGLGISFRYDPIRDSFLVVPSAMQTIVVNANGICKERQGIVVQSYVQWIIDDFGTAYQKLDFSDPLDPMSVVNIQLREQAEAVIKDMVSTMSIDTILSDKSPIIKGLTARLSELADGLGLKIMTVQIKEAVVSSTTLWDNLQKPFRSERAKEARLAEIKNQEEVSNKENMVQKELAFQKIQHRAEIKALETETEAKNFDQSHQERIRRARLEEEQRQEMLQIDLKKMEAEALLQAQKIASELKIEALRFEQKMKQSEIELEQLRVRKEIENNITANRVQERLIEQLPTIVSNLPQAEHQTNYVLGSSQLDGFLNSVGKMLQNLSK